MKEISVGLAQALVHELAKEKGWWDGVDPGDQSVIPEKIALIHSEVSEALEVYRSPEFESLAIVCVYEDPGGANFLSPKAADGRIRKPVGFDSEMADVVIRVMDLCGHLGIDLERAIREKHAFNETRPRRHGGKRC